MALDGVKQKVSVIRMNSIQSTRKKTWRGNDVLPLSWVVNGGRCAFCCYRRHGLQPRWRHERASPWWTSGSSTTKPVVSLRRLPLNLLCYVGMLLARCHTDRLTFRLQGHGHLFLKSRVRFFKSFYVDSLRHLRMTARRTRRGRVERTETLGRGRVRPRG